jgi:hypothetical protein
MLRTAATHLYPGCIIRREGTPSEEAVGEPQLLVFGDGSTATVVIRRSPSWRLASEAHRTSAGTDIPAKEWAIAMPAGADRLPESFKLGRRTT